MPPILLCWPTASEANIGSMAVEFPSNIPLLLLFCHMTDGSRGAVKTDKMVSDMEVHIKQKSFCLLFIFL